MGKVSARLCNDFSHVQPSPLSYPSALPSRTSNRASIAHSLREFFVLALLSFAEYYCLSAQFSLLYRHKGIKWQMLPPCRDAFLADTSCCDSSVSDMFCRRLARNPRLRKKIEWFLVLNSPSCQWRTWPSHHWDNKEGKREGRNFIRSFHEDWPGHGAALLVLAPHLGIGISEITSCLHRHSGLC